MPIEFRCTSCGKLLRVKDDAAGKQAKCPACETVSQVPTAPPPPSAAPGEPPPAAATPPPASESENPYLSPEIQFDPSGRPVLPDEARRKVSAPATALIVVGVIGLVLNAVFMLFYLVSGEMIDHINLDGFIIIIWCFIIIDLVCSPPSVHLRRHADEKAGQLSAGYDRLHRCHRTLLSFNLVLLTPSFRTAVWHLGLSRNQRLERSRIIQPCC